MEHSSNNEQLPKDVQPTEQNDPQAVSAPQSTEKKEKRTTILSASALVCIAVALVFYLIGNLPAFTSFFGTIKSLLNPIIWGALIAYLCNPFLRFFERTIIKNVRPFHVKRMLGVILTYIAIILIVAIFGLILIPSLVDSINQLISNYENYIADAVTYINNLYHRIMIMLPSDSTEPLEEWLSVETVLEMVGSLLGKAGDLFAVVFDYLKTYAMQLISGVTDVILAVFISFYLLSSKELRLAQMRKLTTAFCSPKVRDFLFDTVSTMHRSFGGYFRGVILDAVIIGVAGFIVFTIMDIQLALMIAFIVAVTNIIPVFGPFLGAIPSAFIIFITQPEKVIPFAIAILVMQQIDGNIIAPKILGESTGISSLCVITSLAIMGSLWGILGMIVGVPVFAVIITLVQKSADNKLSKKQLSTNLNDYYVFEAEEVRKSRKKKMFPKLMHSVNVGARVLLGCCCYVGALARYLYLTKIKKQKFALPAFADYRDMFRKERAVAAAAADPAVTDAALEENTAIDGAIDDTPAEPQEEAANEQPAATQKQAPSKAGKSRAQRKKKHR